MIIEAKAIREISFQQTNMWSNLSMTIRWYFFNLHLKSIKMFL